MQSDWDPDGDTKSLLHEHIPALLHAEFAPHNEWSPVHSATESIKNYTVKYRSGI